MTQARQPQNADTNSLNNFRGGLNTTSSVGTYPAGDTPICQNVEITDKGSARTRRGTFLSTVLPSGESDGCLVIPYQTKAGNVYLVVKSTTDIYVYSTREYEYKEIVCSEVIHKPNVWDISGGRVKPDYVITNENVPRIIFTTGVNPPIQLTVVEANTILTTDTVTSFEVSSPYFYNASINNCVVQCNGILIPIQSLSYDDETLSVVLDEVYDLANVEQNPFGYNEIVCEIIFVTWQWMCQADVVRGDELHETVTRFNTNEADKTVAVPVSLLKNIQPLEDDDVYPLLVYSSNTRDAYYNYRADNKPVLATEYSHSGAIYYDSEDLSTIAPNFSHITFGALEADTEPTEVHIVRAFSFFDYTGVYNIAETLGVGLDADFLTVRVNGYDCVLEDTFGLFTDTSPISPGINSKRCFIRRDRRDNSALPFNSSASLGIREGDFDFVSFDAEDNFGLSGIDVVEFIYSRPIALGSNASANVLNSFFLSVDATINLNDGYAVPLYGAQEHCDYLKRSFPRCVYLYQGRIIYGGFSLDPTRLVASDVKDTSITGRNFQNISVKWSNLQVFEPVLVSIASKGNESLITSITESSGSLIVFTRSQCYRVYGGNTSLSPVSVVVSRISSLGCVNPQSSVTIDNAVYFLSESGLYRLSPSIEVGDFAVTLYSRKIQNSLKTINNFKYAYMCYDKKRSLLYLGVSSDEDKKIADRLYVLNINLQAFYEYRHFTNTWLCASSCSENLLRDSYVFFVCGLPNNSGLYLLSHPYYYHTDFSNTNVLIESVDTEVTTEVEDSGSSGGGTTTVTTIVTTIYQRMYIPFSQETGSFDNSIIHLSDYNAGDLGNLEDSCLYIDNVKQEFGKDWFKHSPDILFVNAEVQSGSYLIKPVDFRGEYPLLVYVNDLLQESEVGYSYSLDPTNNNLYEIEFDQDFLSNVDRTRIGYSIPYLLSTPQYVRGSLSGRKFADDISLILDNREYREIYTSLIDANVQDIYKNLLGSFKIQVNLNIMRYMTNADLFGQATKNLLGSSLMLWDDLKHDYQPTQSQFFELTKVRASPKGSDDVIQIFIQTFSPFGFEIVVYSTEVSRRG